MSIVDRLRLRVSEGGPTSIPQNGSWEPMFVLTLSAQRVVVCVRTSCSLQTFTIAHNASFFRLKPSWHMFCSVATQACRRSGEHPYRLSKLLELVQPLEGWACSVLMTPASSDPASSAEEEGAKGRPSRALQEDAKGPGVEASAQPPLSSHVPTEAGGLRGHYAQSDAERERVEKEIVKAEDKRTKAEAEKAAAAEAED